MQSERLDFHILTEKDASHLFQLMNSPKWLEFIGDRNIKVLEDAKAYITSRMSEELSEKGFVNYVMVDRQLNAAVGTCSIHDREGVEGLDIGYALLPDYEGQGYASEGARRVVKLAFEKYQAAQLSAITTKENNASCRLLEKIGFQHQSYIQLPNSREKLKLYVMEK